VSLNITALNAGRSRDIRQNSTKKGCQELDLLLFPLFYEIKHKPVRNDMGYDANIVTKRVMIQIIAVRCRLSSGTARSNASIDVPSVP
jgi:hypothetical protein